MEATVADKIFPRRTRKNTPGEDKTLAMAAIARKYVLAEPTKEQDSALRLLCLDIHNACKYLENSEKDNPYEDNNLRKCCLIAYDCWSVSEKDDLNLTDEHIREKVLVWLTKWRERFFGWRDHPELETLPRMTEITRFLQIWLVADLYEHTNEERGCPAWLQKNGFRKEDQETRYDEGLKRHVIIE